MHPLENVHQLPVRHNTYDKITYNKRKENTEHTINRNAKVHICVTCVRRTDKERTKRKYQLNESIVFVK